MQSAWHLKLLVFIFVIFGSLQKIEDVCLSDGDFTTTYNTQLSNKSLREAFHASQEVLGKGAFGLVKQIDWVEDGKTTTVAVKQVVIKFGEDSDLVEKEIAVMKELLGVERIIQSKGCMTVEEILPAGTQIRDEVLNEDLEAQVVYIVLENLYASFEPIPKLGDRSPLQQVKSGSIDTKLEIYLKFAKALQTLHSKDFVHSDLKPANIMAVDEKIRSVKLVDLGTTAKNGTPYIGSTPIFSSFEALTQQSLAPAMDIYSFGVTVAAIEYSVEEFEDFAFELLNQRKFKELRHDMAKFVADKVSQVEGFGSLEAKQDNFSQIISDCVSKHPNHRPSASRLVERIENYIKLIKLQGDQGEASQTEDKNILQIDSMVPGKKNQKPSGLLKDTGNALGLDSVAKKSKDAQKHKDLGIDSKDKDTKLDDPEEHESPHSSILKTISFVVGLFLIALSIPVGYKIYKLNQQ